MYTYVSTDFSFVIAMYVYQRYTCDDDSLKFLLTRLVVTTLSGPIVWVENSVEIITVGHNNFLVKVKLMWVQVARSFNKS